VKKTADCATCPKRHTCKSLCKEAERYANQDWRNQPRKEINFSDLTNNYGGPQTDAIIHNH